MSAKRLWWRLLAAVFLLGLSYSSQYGLMNQSVSNEEANRISRAALQFKGDCNDLESGGRGRRRILSSIAINDHDSIEELRERYKHCGSLAIKSLEIQMQLRHSKQAINKEVVDRDGANRLDNIPNEPLDHSLATDNLKDTDISYSGRNLHGLKVRDIPNATLEMRAIDGWPVCVWSNVCLFMQTFKFFILEDRFNRISSPEHDERMLNLTGTTTQDRRCLLDLPRYVRQLDANLSVANILYLNGTTFLIDTYQSNAHFDHVGAKAIQFFNLMRSISNHQDYGSNAIDQVFMFRQRRFPSKKRPMKSALTQLVVRMLGNYVSPSRSLYRTDLERHPIVCMEKSLEVRKVSERVFANEAQVRQWSEYVSRNWRPWTDNQPRNRCLDRSAPVMLLTRKEGKGARKMMNAMTVVDVLMELGIICSPSELQRITFGGESSLAEQAAYFKEYALLLSSHSAQLRNVDFAHPMSSTLEVRPDALNPKEMDVWRRFPSPYCTNFLCPSVYNVSWAHQADDPVVQKLEYRADFNVSREILKRDLMDLMHRQRAMLIKEGCPLLDIHDDKRVRCL